MAARQYVWKKRDSYSKPLGLTKLMAVAAIKVASGAGPFVLSQDGDPISGKLTRSEALSRFKRAVSMREIGSVFRIRKGNGNVVLTARAVRTPSVPDTDSTNGNARADYLWNWIRQGYAGFNPRYAGAYVCKPSSQHAYGNALDVFFDTLTHQDTVAGAVVASSNSTRPYHVITRNKIWTKGVGWHAYTGDYHYHLHVDFDPQYSGGCGVRP